MRRAGQVTLGMAGQDQAPAAAEIGEAFEVQAQLEISQHLDAVVWRITAQQDKAGIPTPGQAMDGFKFERIAGLRRRILRESGVLRECRRGRKCPGQSSEKYRA
ncbi:hypothetical protein MACH15_28720 [Maricaulis maris]|nr:hypothetical protein MACH15_28720 [Maricaulis maris]